MACGDDPSPQLGFLRGIFLAYHLASNDKLNHNNQETEHIQTQINNTLKSGPNKINTFKNVRSSADADKPVRRSVIRQTEPGLVTFYNIRLGNGEGLFLQPGARMG